MEVRALDCKERTGKGNSRERGAEKKQKRQGTVALEIRVTCNGLPLRAVVDTAADRTILSERAYRALKIKPKVLSKVDMWSAGEGQILPAFQVGPMEIEIGKKRLERDIVVAEIRDEFLLGIDILRELEAVIDVKREVVRTGDEEIRCLGRSEWGAGPEEGGTIRLVKGVTIPPRTEMVIPTSFEKNAEREKGDNWVLMSGEIGLPVLVASAIYDRYRGGGVSLVNEGNGTVTLSKGTMVGTWREIAEEEIMEEEMDKGCEKVRKERRSSIPWVRRIDSNGKTDEEWMQLSEIEQMIPKVGEGLTTDEVGQIKDLVQRYRGIFAQSEFDLGKFDAMSHSIETGTAVPIKMGLRRTPLHFREEEDELLAKMLRAGVIRPSTSSWAAAPVLVRKKNGGVRWAIDYRRLNELTTPDVFPLPLMSEAIDALEGNVWFSKLDANSAYWQIPLEEESAKKTAFRTKQGLFEFSKMPFGLINAPSTYCRAMGLVMEGLNWRSVLTFLDDICVLGRDTKEHLGNLQEVFQRFKVFRLRLKPGKCELFRREVEFLGRKIGEGGVTLSDASIVTIKQWKEPESAKEVMQFLGLANFHREFIKGFSEKAEPLQRVLKKGKFEWGKEQVEAFRVLQEALLAPEMLAIPTAVDEFILDVDASGVAIGAELLQVQKGVERVIAFGSFSLHHAQRKYCTTRRELLAVVRFTGHFKHYLLGRQFLVRTDHHSLVWLMRFRHLDGVMARWLEELNRFNFKIEYRKGSEHGGADALSRRTEKGECGHLARGLDISQPPCKGCRFCERVMERWVEFETLISDVVALASPRGGEEEETKRVGETGATVSGTGEVKVGEEVVSPRGGEESETEKGGETGATVSGTGEVKVGEKKGLKVRAISDKKGVHGTVERENEQGREGGGGVGNGFCMGDPERVKLAQRGEEKWTWVWEFLEEGKEPDQGELHLAGPEEKYMWVNRKLCKIRAGMLYFVHRGEEKLSIPGVLRKEAFRLCHAVPTAGHQGVNRTKDRVKREFWWFRMGRDITDGVNKCAECILNKAGGVKLKHPLVPDHMGAPMERIHVDFLGPLPRTMRGNEHVLVLVDNFTKWIEAIPTASQTAEETARSAVNEFFARFGVPFDLRSDQGRNFESRLFSETCRILGIRKSRTTAYRPSANGQAERVNRTLMAAVRCFVSRSGKDWDEYVPLIASALRSAVNRNTGFTPNRMMLGRETRLPAELWVPVEEQKPTSPVEYVSDLESALETAHELARQTLKTELKKAKSGWDVRSRVVGFEVGQMVFCVNKAAKNKLAPKWVGPFVVIEKITPYVFKIRGKGRELVTNHDHMKVSREEEIPLWALRIREGLGCD